MNAAVARTAANFGARRGVPGLFVGDLDQKGASALSLDAFGAHLLALVPELDECTALLWHSGSAMIYDATGRQLAGAGGARLYIGIADQADFGRALAVMNKRALLAGVGGGVAVAANGSMRVNWWLDQMMGRAGGSLDFAPGGAHCTGGLEQRRPSPVVLADGGKLLDTRTSLPDLSAAEEAEVQALLSAARLKAEPEAVAKRAAWLAGRQQEAAVEAASTGGDVEAARERVRREVEALAGGVLLGSSELIHVDERGHERPTTVDKLLADPKAWHGKKFLSPHDPDHRGRSPDAIAYLLQARPCLFDLNDCVTYRLQRQPVALQVTTGNRSQLADQIADALASRADLLNVAGQVVQVVAGEFLAVSRAKLAWLIGTHVALHRQGKERTAPVDADQQVVEQVAALLVERCRKVKGRSSIQLIDPAGRIIDQPGLDEATGYYIDLPAAPPPVTAAPTRRQTVAALRRAWAPLSAYEWTTAHCRAAALATVLLVPLRPTIDAVPGLMVDSPVQAAGKSSVCRAILELLQGHSAGVKVWTGDGDVEIEKYLLSLARAGAGAVCWDNVTGVFESSTLAGAITEGRVSARLLGANTALSPTFRAIWLASGNNAALGRDLGTRFLQARISCPDGNPQARSFAFSPHGAARADRDGIIRAILTVWRAWHAAEAPRACGDSRFPEWGRTVRALCFWLQSSGLATEAGLCEVGDPADSIENRAAASDPDAENSAELFDALLGAFGDASPFTAREVAALARSGQESGSPNTRALSGAVQAFFPRHQPTPQAIGSVLKFRRDRVHDGLKLVMLPKPEGGRAARQGQDFAIIRM